MHADCWVYHWNGSSASEVTDWEYSPSSCSTRFHFYAGVYIHIHTYMSPTPTTYYKIHFLIYPMFN